MNGRRSNRRNCPNKSGQALATLAVGAVVGLMLDYLSSGDKKRTSDALDLFTTGFDALLKSASLRAGNSA